MGIEAVIFDMDGVIVDSEPLWHDTEVEVFARHGKVLTSAEKHLTMGWRLNEVVEHWVPDLDSNRQAAVAEELIDGMIDRLQHTQPMGGVRETLDLIASNQLPIAIASSSFYRLIEAVTKSFDIAHYFSVIHSAQDEERGKPHPDVYLSAARKLNVPPTNCLAIEDSANGVKSAQGAGMKVVAIPSEDMDDDPIFETAELRLGSMTELDSDVWRLLQSLD